MLNKRQDSIGQFLAILALVEDSALAMNCPVYAVYITKQIVAKHLGLSAYYASKLMAQLVAYGIFHREGNRYRYNHRNNLALFMAQFVGGQK